MQALTVVSPDGNLKVDFLIAYTKELHALMARSGGQAIRIMPKPVLAVQRSTKLNLKTRRE